MHGTACRAHQLQSSKEPMAVNGARNDLKCADHIVRTMILNSRLLYR